MEKQTKIGLAISLFLCLLDMPYGFYQLVRFIALIGFGFLAFDANEKDQITEVIIFGSLAILFQPFMKISLGRELWNLVDLVVGIGLLLSAFQGNQNQTKTK